MAMAPLPLPPLRRCSSSCDLAGPEDDDSGEREPHEPHEPHGLTPPATAPSAARSLSPSVRVAGVAGDAAAIPLPPAPATASGSAARGPSPTPGTQRYISPAIVAIHNAPSPPATASGLRPRGSPRLARKQQQHPAGTSVPPPPRTAPAPGTAGYRPITAHPLYGQASPTNTNTSSTSVGLGSSRRSPPTPPHLRRRRLSGLFLGTAPHDADGAVPLQRQQPSAAPPASPGSRRRPRPTTTNPTPGSNYTTNMSLTSLRADFVNILQPPPMSTSSNGSSSSSKGKSADGGGGLFGTHSLHSGVHSGVHGGAQSGAPESVDSNVHANRPRLRRCSSAGDLTDLAAELGWPSASASATGTGTAPLEFEAQDGADAPRPRTGFAGGRRTHIAAYLRRVPHDLLPDTGHGNVNGHSAAPSTSPGMAGSHSHNHNQSHSQSHGLNHRGMTPPLSPLLARRPATTATMPQSGPGASLHGGSDTTPQLWLGPRPPRTAPSGALHMSNGSQHHHGSGSSARRAGGLARSPGATSPSHLGMPHDGGTLESLLTAVGKAPPPGSSSSNATTTISPPSALHRHAQLEQQPLPALGAAGHGAVGGVGGRGGGGRGDGAGGQGEGVGAASGQEGQKGQREGRTGGAGAASGQKGGARGVGTGAVGGQGERRGAGEHGAGGGRDGKGGHEGEGEVGEEEEAAAGHGGEATARTGVSLHLASSPGGATGSASQSISPPPLAMLRPTSGGSWRPSTAVSQSPPPASSSSRSTSSPLLLPAGQRSPSPNPTATTSPTSTLPLPGGRLPPLHSNRPQQNGASEASRLQQNGASDPAEQLVEQLLSPRLQRSAKGGVTNRGRTRARTPTGNAPGSVAGSGGAATQRLAAPGHVAAPQLTKDSGSTAGIRGALLLTPPHGGAEGSGNATGSGNGDGSNEYEATTREEVLARLAAGLARGGGAGSGTGGGSRKGHRGGGGGSGHASHDDNADADLAYLHMSASLSRHARSLQQDHAAGEGEQQPHAEAASHSNEGDDASMASSSRQTAAYRGTGPRPCDNCVPVRVGGGFLFVGFGDDQCRCLKCGRHLNTNLNDDHERQRLAASLPSDLLPTLAAMPPISTDDADADAKATQDTLDSANAGGGAVGAGLLPKGADNGSSDNGHGAGHSGGGGGGTHSSATRRGGGTPGGAGRSGHGAVSPGARAPGSKMIVGKTALLDDSLGSGSLADAFALLLPPEGEDSAGNDDAAGAGTGRSGVRSRSRSPRPGSKDGTRQQRPGSRQQESSGAAGKRGSAAGNGRDGDAVTPTSTGSDSAASVPQMGGNSAGGAGSGQDGSALLGGDTSQGNAQLQTSAATATSPPAAKTPAVASGALPATSTASVSDAAGNSGNSGTSDTAAATTGDSAAGGAGAATAADSGAEAQGGNPTPSTPPAAPGAGEEAGGTDADTDKDGEGTAPSKRRLRPVPPVVPRGDDDALSADKSHANGRGSGSNRTPGSTTDHDNDNEDDDSDSDASEESDSGAAADAGRQRKGPMKLAPVGPATKSEDYDRFRSEEVRPLMDLLNELIDDGGNSPGIPLSDTVSYLAKFCLLDARKLGRYRQIFNQSDKDKDDLLNMRELCQALRTVTEDQITKREMDFIVRVLELADEASAKKGKLNNKVTFRVFAVVAALSERVAALDGDMKGLINSLNFKGLESKLKLAKHMFYVNDTNQLGTIELDAVEVELHAGNLSDAHRTDVMDTLNKEGLSSLTFLDYLAYIPLFLGIHDTIVDNPLDTSKHR